MAVRHVTGRAQALTYAALLGLTLLSLATSLVDLGAGDLVVALAIAAAKSVLVLLFFMHLVEERFASRAVVVVAALLLVILVTLTTTDVATRHTFPAGPAAPTR